MISFSWKEFQKIDGACGQDTHSQRTSVQYSLFTSAERIARAWPNNCITSLCAWKESVIWSAHVSLFVVLSPAAYHEHIIFLTHSSVYHHTRTRSTIGTTRSSPRTPRTSCTSPCSPSRQAARHQESLSRGGRPRTTTPTTRPLESSADVVMCSREALSLTAVRSAKKCGVEENW